MSPVWYRSSGCGRRTPPFIPTTVETLSSFHGLLRPVSFDPAGGSSKHWESSPPYSIWNDARSAGVSLDPNAAGSPLARIAGERSRVLSLSFHGRGADRDINTPHHLTALIRKHPDIAKSEKPSFELAARTFTLDIDGRDLVFNRQCSAAPSRTPS